VVTFSVELSLPISGRLFLFALKPQPIFFPEREKQRKKRYAFQTARGAAAVKVFR
jgi:hypothetical protein